MIVDSSTTSAGQHESLVGERREILRQRVRPLGCLRAAGSPQPVHVARLVQPARVAVVAEKPNRAVAFLGVTRLSIIIVSLDAAMCSS